MIIAWFSCGVTSAVACKIALSLYDWRPVECFKRGFKEGAKWQREEAIESLSSVLGNWVHGGDADCIIAEFEEKLDK